jgi:hypothetical protein
MKIIHFCLFLSCLWLVACDKKVEVVDTCTAVCIHGDCVDDKCVCEQGWKGDSCQHIIFPTSIIWKNCLLDIPKNPIAPTWDPAGSNEGPDLKIAIFVNKDYLLDELTIADADVTQSLVNDWNDKTYENKTFSLEVPGAEFYSIVLFDVDGSETEFMEVTYFNFEFRDNAPMPFEKSAFGFGSFRNANMHFRDLEFKFK